MKIVNYTIFLLPFVLAFTAALFVSTPGPVFVLSYFVLLGMFVSGFVLIDFIVLYRHSKKPTTHVTDEPAKLRIAVVITTFNEDPKLVLDTVLSAKLAVGKTGDVYILDDSTEQATRQQLDNYRGHDFKILRRNSRRGYKAGAINDWLKSYGDKYDLLAIFDADQRPMPFIFKSTTAYFNDSKMAFVQVPQYYSDISSGVSLGAFFQQLPFLRLIMNGRNMANSAFSLGSGTIYRIQALTEIGGLDESTITEDISTALKLHAKGWRSTYVDKPLIWYGMPPRSIAGYLLQQGRWSLGGFQLLTKILSAKLTATQFFDYYNGWLYWFNVGPITLFEVAAPVVFLLLGIAFLSWNPLIYLAVYIPYFLLSLSVYFSITRKYNYGLKGFIYHHAVQLLAFISVISSFAAWLTKRRRPFAVTPKTGTSKTPLRILTAYLAVIVLLCLSAIKGLGDAVIGNADLLPAYGINLFWALYFLYFFIFGLYIILRRKAYSEEYKLSIKPMYLAVTGEHNVVDTVYESVKVEEKIAEAYGILAKKLPLRIGETLSLLSRESAGHAASLRQVLNWLEAPESQTKDKTASFSEFVGSLERFIPLVDKNMDEENILILLQLLLETEREFSEEIYIGLLTEIFSESLLRKTGKYQEIKETVERIRGDELRHTALIEELRNSYL